MTTIIVIFISDPEVKIFNDLSYKQSYKRLAIFADKRNIDLRFVIGAKNYNNGIFLSYWHLNEEEMVYTTEEFQANLVYMRSRIDGIYFSKRVNNQFLDEVCRDKYKAFISFPNLVKKTVLVYPNNFTNIQTLETQQVVIKPRYGSSGRNVQVLERQKINTIDLTDEEYIAQELIDSSSGINGLIPQRHELRIFVFNGEIRAAYIRVPAANSYLANIAMGGTEKQIKLNDIPQAAVNLKNLVDDKFTAISPRLYTIDIMFEQNRPWIVELNDNPGMPDIAVQPFTDDYLNALLNFLTESANN